MAPAAWPTVTTFAAVASPAMTNPMQALWDAPAVDPAPPRRVWRDWALVAAVAALAVLEAALRTDLPWRWLWAAVLVGLAPTLLWRRTRPFTMFAIAFGAGTAVSLVTGDDSQLFTTAYFLILLYAVFRWGSGRALLCGGAIVVAGLVLSAFVWSPALGDVIGGTAVAVMASTLGLALRWRSGARARELEQVRLVERAQFARDLHDTVAHHVSAIAIQAQAGIAVADRDPDATAQVLRTIEAEASRTLRDMRAIVGVLRADGPAELAPTPTLDDLQGLAGGSDPAISVRTEGDTESVPSAVAAATFRIAQEAVTNARRHARGVRRIDVDVEVNAAGLRLDVRDDGEAEASRAVHDGVPGYGIRGMKERAALLGGTCEAGPTPEGGWLVSVSLPRAGWTA